jgi:hypothetical protein
MILKALRVRILKEFLEGIVRQLVDDGRYVDEEFLVRGRTYVLGSGDNCRLSVYFRRLAVAILVNRLVAYRPQFGEKLGVPSQDSLDFPYTAL